MMTEPQTLDQWLAHCERLHPKSIDMGLARVQAVAQRMGIRFSCPVFTVAGTNGKGSTCAMLESILRHAGYRTGVYTSPHLVHFEERLRLLEPRGSDFLQARQWLQQSQDLPLRSGDALHLALAKRHKLTLASADRSLGQCAQALDLPLQLIG